MTYQVTLVPNFLVSKWIGILDTRWAIILTGIFSPMAVFILTKYMRRIPSAMVEAAKLDGAGDWQIFTKIYMPLCRATLYSVAILVFIDYWNMVEQPLILLSGHTRGDEAETLEGRIVKLADKIAYINHDIDDAIRGGVISEGNLPPEAKRFLGETKSQRINTLVMSAINNTVDTVQLDRDVKSAFDILHDFMFERVYTNPVCKGEESKAIALVQKLYEFFSTHPDELPNEYIQIAWSEGAERAAVDYIAGMTDSYALKVFSDYFIPSGWNG